MPQHDWIKTEPFDLGLREASQREAAAVERWLDDGGASGNKAADEAGVGDVSPLWLVKLQGGLL